MVRFYLPSGGSGSAGCCKKWVCAFSNCRFGRYGGLYQVDIDDDEHGGCAEFIC